MKLTNKIQKAINLAAEKHCKQIRKSSHLPYVVHPFSVAIILSDHIDDENTIVAGLLHDFLEDVNGYEYDDMKNDFGEKVADIVRGVSEELDFDESLTDKETWQERKSDYLKNLKNVSRESLLVCAADKIHNLKSMIIAYQDQGRKMWNDFNAPKDRQVWYYGEALEILKSKLDNGIVSELEREFDRFKKMI